MFQKMSSYAQSKRSALRNSFYKAIADNRGGDHAVGLVVCGLIVIVIAVLVLDAFTGFFSNDLLPNMKKSITDMFTP